MLTIDIQRQIDLLKPVRIARKLGVNGRSRLIGGYLMTIDWVSVHADERSDDYYTLLWLLRGNGRYTGPDDEDVELEPGSLIHRPPWTKFTLTRSTDDWLEFAVRLSEDVYDHFIDLGIFRPTPQVSRIEITSLGLTRINDYLAFIRSSPGELTPDVIIETQRLFVYLSQLQQGMVVSEKSLQIDRACQLLTQSVHDDVSLQDIASQVGMGYHLFRKEFKEQVGVSPKDYFIRKKIETAQDYMTGTDLPLKTIAEELGYTDVLAFYRQFKRVSGVPPATYRKGRG